ncbi:adenylyltransferase/cytidyltransferase family protein, partial [Mycobacterium tuberculosis]|nr:adenylyltransferase/cytidyltransferase family protein [Mycobacterium tuberculosis]
MAQAAGSGPAAVDNATASERSTGAATSHADACGCSFPLGGGTMVIAVYPGTFDPFTRGHEDLVRRASNI